MTSELAQSNVIESVVIDGDLSKLTPEQRVNYYKSVCTSLNLNPLTRPFNYITLNGKLTLYATKTAADQLRNNHNVSVDDISISEDPDSFTVIIKGHDANGRSDVEIGVVSKKDMQGNLGNAKMKAVTKAKRRLTLSLCGLGMLDETEIETIPAAHPVNVNVDTGEVIETQSKSMSQASPTSIPSTHDDMDYQQACLVTNSEGKPYGSLPNTLLANMTIGINKGLKKSDLSNEKQSEYLHKLDAIKAILEHDPQEKRFENVQPALAVQE